MTQQRGDASRDVVLGIGSPHGDDRIGWLAVDALEREIDLPMRVRKVASPLDIVEHLENCERLVLVDACRSTADTGSIIRIEWPDERFAALAPRSSHAFDIPTALELASHLGRLPQRVVFLGVNVGNCAPGAEIGATVRGSLPELSRLVRRELCATHKAAGNQDPAGV